MPYTVTTYESEDELATALTAVVTTVFSEDALDDAIAAATNVTAIVVKGGGYFTLIDNAQIVNVRLIIVAKRGFFTVILETV